MGDVERSNKDVRNNMMDGRGSLVTVNVERGEDESGGGNNNNNNNNRSGPNYDLGMTLAEIGMGVSFEMDEPEGVTGDEVCPRKGDVVLVDGEDSLLEIPELTKSCCGLPPRTIPFRSASFSQVDVTSDGKYVRNPRSPITLKPTAFCLLNSSNQQKGATTVAVAPAGATTATTAHPTIAASSVGTPGNYNSSTIPRHGQKSSAFPSEKNSANVIINSAKVDLLPLPPLPSSKTTGQGGPEKQSDLSVQNSHENNSSIPPPPPQLLSECIPLEADESTEIPNTGEPATFSHIEDEASAVPSATCTQVGESQSAAEEIAVPLHEPVNVCGKQSMTDTAGIRFYLGSEDASAGVTEEFKLAPKSEWPAASSDDSNLGDQPENSGKCDAVKPTSEATPAIPLENPLSYNSDNTSEVITAKESETPSSSPPPTSTSITSDTNMTGAAGSAGTSESEKRAGTLEAAMLSDDEVKSHLLRQSSGQSDGSDDIPHLNVLAASISSALDLSCSSPPLSETDPRCSFQASTVGHYGSPPSSSSSLVASSTPSLASTRGTSLDDGNAKKEISRANSVNDPNARPLPPRRYNKRPLRGPYGKMLEAEMNKLIPGRSTATVRDYDNNSDFCRESKSSSPSRSLYSSLSHVDPDPRTAALMSSNPLLMASLDDLHFTTNQSKTLNPRSRKTSSQLPAQTSFPGEGTPPLAFHQRTASSPSQLLYTASSSSPAIEISGSSHGPEIRRRLLDGSPRGHVLAEVVETEKSYVDSLRILVKKYMEPLKLLDYIDVGLVDEIFFQIPKILWHHERLLDALQKRVTDDMQCVGDVLLQTFRQNSLLECYSLFVNNWKNAKASLKMAVASKPAFARFLEDNARQHKGKLTLDSLLIMPIQRIPRYELLVKELLKHTDSSHEDHARLNIALESIRQFALHIDCASVDPNDNREIEIEGWGSGLGHLVRQDMVTLCTSSNVKKERALFLFADSLVIASIKRKSTMRKPSANTSHSSSNNWEGCKFKLLMKIPLTDAHLLNEDHDGVGPGGTGSSATSGGSSGSGSVTTANKSTSSSSSSSFSSKSVGGGGNSSLNSHEETDDLKIIHKMMELAAMLKCSHAGLDEILKDLASNLKHHNDNGDAVDFEIKSSDNSDSPEVLKILFGSTEKKSAWLESFQDTLNKFIRYGFGKTPPVQFVQALPIRKTRAGLQLSCAAPVSLHNKVSKTLEMSDVWVANSDGYVGQICILTLHPEPAITSCNGVCNSRITCIISVPPPPPLSATPIHPSLSTNHHHDEHHQPHVHSLGYESEDESHRNRQGNKSMEHWSVWLGTEDGGLHVYDCSDSVRVKKNRHKIQHSAPLHCIVYFGNRVVVSLGNGDVAVYSRNTSGKGWSIADPSWVTIGSALYPVTKMICVRTQIWCACGSQIKVYGENGGMLELLQAIQVTIEGNQVTRGISCIAASDEHVWVAVQGTSIIKCYNNTSFECLIEMNVSADVAKILAGCDDIIRQHKSACLRVTALLYAPDKTLWVGTSAGAILTVTYVNHSYKTTPLCHGHTGQVRFMTCCTIRDSCTIISGGDGYEEFRPMTPLFQPSSNNSSSFGSMMSSLMGESSVDISGREDSTNHLLIWRIPKPSDN